MAFVPASRMAEQSELAVMDKSSKISGQMCRQEALQSARSSSGQTKHMDSFNGKCVQCKNPWKVVHVGTCSMWTKLNNENRKSILHPPLHGYQQQTKSIPRGKAMFLVIFSKNRLGQWPGNCQKNASLIAATLADAWQEFQEPSTILAMKWSIEGGVGSKSLVGGNPEKLGTSRRNWPCENLEPSGT